MSRGMAMHRMLPLMALGMMGGMTERGPMRRTTPEEREAAAKRRAEADEADRVREAKRLAEYEAIAAPIRAERLRRKAENFAKRQPKK